MIKNKMLFFASIIIGLIVFLVPFILFMANGVESNQLLGGLFIYSAIVGFVTYTLVYLSLNKNSIITKVYKRSVVLAVVILLLGILLIVFF